MTHEDKLMKKLKENVERIAVLGNNDLPKIRWALTEIEIAPIPAYPSLTYTPEFPEDEEQNNDYILKVCSVASPSTDPTLRNAVMLPIVLISKLHNSVETICKTVGTILQTEQFIIFKEWKSKDTPPDTLPFIIRVHSDKTEKVGDDDGFMYYVSVHIELEPERYERICHIYSKIFQNVFENQTRGLQQ